MRRILLAVSVVATIVITLGSVEQRLPDVRGTSDSQPTAVTVAASVTGDATEGAGVRERSGSLPNQLGQEIPVGVQSPPPVAFPSAGPPVSDATVRMHILRNGRLWTVEVPAIRTSYGGTSTVPDADEIVNSQLPVMWRCGGELQSGCWPFPGEPPGNPDIADRP